MNGGKLMPSAEDELYLVDKLIADAEDARCAAYKVRVQASGGGRQAEPVSGQQVARPAAAETSCEASGDTDMRP